MYDHLSVISKVVLTFAQINGWFKDLGFILKALPGIFSYFRHHVFNFLKKTMARGPRDIFSGTHLSSAKFCKQLKEILDNPCCE